jgi:hypothetical protein
MSEIAPSRAAITDSLERLRAAGALLLQRRPRDVVETLGRVLDGFRDSSSPWRRALESELPAATGFTREVVRAGLDLALDGWHQEALCALAEAELGRPAFHEEGAGSTRGASRTSLITGFDTTAVLLGGSLPTPTILALLTPLVLRSPVLAKTSHHDPVTARVFARAVAETDPGLGACIDVLSFPGDDGVRMAAFLGADCVAATGSDETIASIAARVRPPRRFVGYGHRVSVAVLGPRALDEPSLEGTAAALALDVALWDQLGCLSPVAVYVVGGVSARRGATGARTVAEAVAAALADLEKRLPRGHVAREDAAAIIQARSEAEMRTAAGRPVTLLRDASDAWTVVCEADAHLRSAPLHRFLRIHPVGGIEGLFDALRPLGPHLAGVALAGFGDVTRDVTTALAALGASRICEPGRLQAPPLAWHHDGQPVLLPLARFADVEA